MYNFLFCRRRPHPAGNRSSSFTLLQSLAAEDSSEKPTYSVLLGQLFAFIGTTPDHAVSMLINVLTKLTPFIIERNAFTVSSKFLCWTKLTNFIFFLTILFLSNTALDLPKLADLQFIAYCKLCKLSSNHLWLRS